MSSTKQVDVKAVAEKLVGSLLLQSEKAKDVAEGVKLLYNTLIAENERLNSTTEKQHTEPLPQKRAKKQAP